ncbi:MAG: hypothetical protein OWV35_04995, partial [Firmicutes bacterium]|nr:hypothetical protein [Bacillota bacterium]
MAAIWASPLTLTLLLLALAVTVRQAGQERRHQAILERLSARLREFRVRPVHAPADELEQPLVERVLLPLWRGWEDAVARRVLPARAEAELARSLRMAGVHLSPRAFT